MKTPDLVPKQYIRVTKLHLYPLNLYHFFLKKENNMSYRYQKLSYCKNAYFHIFHGINLHCVKWNRVAFKWLIS